MFGAQKFYFYVESSTPELEKCLNEYQQLGIVDVRPWSLPEPLVPPEVGFSFFDVFDIIVKQARDRPKPVFLVSAVAESGAVTEVQLRP